MTQSTLGGFFSGGAKGITWPDDPRAPGGRTGVTGTIEIVHPPEPVMDPKTQLPVVPPREQVRVVLVTTERDPDIADDDGRRTLYVKSYMRGAIGEAIRKAGAREPEVGGTLTLTFTHITPPDRPGLSPSKHFTAQYVPPAVTGGFFNGQPAQPATPAAPANTGPAKPASIDQNLWDAMDASTRAAVTNAVGGGLTGEPAKPDSIDQSAWDKMDLTTKQSIASTMAQLPPF